MKKLSKFASLSALVLAGLLLSACKQPTSSEISDGDGTETPAEPTTPETGESGTETKPGIERLPGTSGGSTNSKDIFVGKTFYDNADESKANEKYVFGTDGTFTSYRRNNLEPSFTDPSASINPTYEYKYSLSSDGKIIYYATSKTSVEIDDEGTEQLMSYDEVCKAGKDEYKEDFFGVKMYEISEKTDSDGNSYKFLSGTVDSSSGDLSKMAFGGCFENVDGYGYGLKIDDSEYKFQLLIFPSGPEIWLGETTHAAYKTTKIDSSKLYFEKCTDESGDSFETAYSVTGSGTATKITVTFPEERGGQVLELEFDSYSDELYPAQLYTVSLDSYGTEKLKVISAVREVTNLGLSDAKTLVEGTLPAVLKSGVSKTEADAIITKITEAGGTASLKKE